MQSSHCSRHAILSAAGACLLTAACGTDQESRPRRCSDNPASTNIPDVPLAHATEHLQIHASDDDMPVCAGTALDYERSYQHFVQELGLTDPLPVSVYVVRSVADYCSSQLIPAGCRKNDGTIVASPGTVFHELGHAANCELRSSSAPALAEGLATAFGHMDPLTDKTDPREFITAESPTEIYYPAAGHFVRWLLETRDLDAFWTAFEQAPRSGGEGVLPVLEQAYGQSADALFDEYMAEAPYMWIPHRLCEDLEVLEPVGEQTWQFEATFDCSDPATFGPYERLASSDWEVFEGEPAMFHSFLVEIDTPGSYRFAREMETGVEIEFCVDQDSLSEQEADELWDRHWLFAGIGGYTDVDLRAGTYRVNVRRSGTETVPVWLDIGPDPG